MNDDLPRWASALEDLASEYGDAAHPTSEELSEYVEGGLPTAAMEELRDHLVRCDECRQVVLDLQSFPNIESPPGVQELGADPLEEEWNALMVRYDPPAKVGEGVFEAVPEIEDSHRYRRWIPTPLLAAALLAACFGLLLWVVGERRARHQLNTDIAAWMAEVNDLKMQLDEQREIQGQALRNVRVIDLLPASTTRGVRSEVRQVSVTEWTSWIVWILDIEDSEELVSELGSIKVEIVDSEETIIWSENGLREVETGALTFITSRIPEGEYRIRLAAQTGAQIAEYSIQLTAKDLLTNGG